MKRKRAATWDEYRRLRLRFLMGLEFMPPLRPPREPAAEPVTVAAPVREKRAKGTTT